MSGIAALKPSIPCRELGYKPTEIGILPEDWQAEDVASVCDIIDGDRGSAYPGAGDLLDYGYCLFLSATNVTANGFKFRDCQFITHEKDSALRKGKLRRGDIALTTRGTIGNFALYSTEVPFDQMRINSGMVIIRRKGAFTSEAYIFAALRSQILSKQIDRISFGSAQPQLTVAGISALKLPIPPTIAEQQAIAEALSDADALIEGLESLIAKKRAIKQGATQDLLIGKRRLPGFEGAWKRESIGALEASRRVKLSRGQVISKIDIANAPGVNPIYSSSVHNDGLFGYYGPFMFHEELITWSIDGGGNFFYRRKHKFSVTNVCGYMRVDEAHVSCQFLAFALQLQHSAKVFDYQSKAHPSVVRKDYAVDLPPFDEQTTIAAVLSDMDAEIEALDGKLAKARAIKQGMMQELLTGRVRLV